MLLQGCCNVCPKQAQRNFQAIFLKRVLAGFLHTVYTKCSTFKYPAVESM